MQSASVSHRPRSLSKCRGRTVVASWNSLSNSSTARHFDNDLGRWLMDALCIPFTGQKHPPTIPFWNPRGYLWSFIDSIFCVIWTWKKQPAIHWSVLRELHVQRSTFSSKRMSDIFDYTLTTNDSDHVTSQAFELSFSKVPRLFLGITSQLSPYHNWATQAPDSIDTEQHCQSALSTNFYTSLPTLFPFRSVNPSLSVAYCLPWGNA